MARRKQRTPKLDRELEDEQFIDNELEEDENEPPSIDPYEVLGLELEATADDVKKAYRKLALIHHPGTPSHYFHSRAPTDSS
jgi:DnaJ homolog subfamily C member 9